ncbi:MAG: (Dimethylallyl)adenosine tRNA methylthiotransferase MiaB [candidate division TM6 bacterium GW2011_GWF2_38_10]|nr:MAG: (Dimethylallyl)adenosine tRNA methylthiotransferase MiaB [candidate division TM6 bacterium GW2011_GWF2_38_10]
MISFFIKTYGCQANVADSEGIARFLLDNECHLVHQEQDADLIIINTCAIRDKAEQKLFSYIGQLAPLKKAKPYIKIGIIGCVASYKKTEIYQSFDHVSFVYGARDEMQSLQAYLADAIEKIKTLKQLFTENPSAPVSARNRQDRDIKKLVERKSLLSKLAIKPLSAASISEFNLKKHLTPTQNPNQLTTENEIKRSYINIMTGCNKYCSYCIVPFTRGRETSYPMSDIIAAIERDVQEGAKEVMLIGQNVNSYIDPQTQARFPELIEKVALIPGNFWIRFISPHPQDMTIDLFDVMARHRPKIAASLHFPLQAGSDRILHLMNRNYDTKTFLEKIGWIREKLPGATISTDIIVGFPGETQQDFEQTMKMIELVRFDLIYSFIYSPRRYTKAAEMEDNCSLDEKTKRLEHLQTRQMEIAAELNSQLIGKKIKVLVEKRLSHGKLLSRTEGNLRVLIDGPDALVGTFVTVRVEHAGPANLQAVLDH